MATRTALSIVFGLLLIGAAHAQSPLDTVRIGVLNDMSGVYADDQGPGSVLAAQMAVEDYGGKAVGRRVEVISGDHQNKVDVGTAIAQRWIENEGISMIADVTNSGDCARGQRGGARSEQGHAGVRRRHRAPHRREVHTQHHPVDL